MPRLSLPPQYSARDTPEQEHSACRQERGEKAEGHLSSKLARISRIPIQADACKVGADRAARRLRGYRQLYHSGRVEECSLIDDAKAGYQQPRPTGGRQAVGRGWMRRKQTRRPLRAPKTRPRSGACVSRLCATGCLQLTCARHRRPAPIFLLQFIPAGHHALYRGAP